MVQYGHSTGLQAAGREHALSPYFSVPELQQARVCWLWVIAGWMKEVLTRLACPMGHDFAPIDSVSVIASASDC